MTFSKFMQAVYSHPIAALQFFLGLMMVFVGLIIMFVGIWFLFKNTKMLSGFILPHKDDLDLTLDTEQLKQPKDFNQKWNETFEVLKQECLLTPPPSPNGPWTDKTVAQYNEQIKPFHSTWGATWMWFLASPLIALGLFFKRTAYLVIAIRYFPKISSWYREKYNIWLLGLPIILSVLHLVARTLFLPFDVLVDCSDVFTQKKALWRDHSRYAISDSPTQKRDFIPYLIFSYPSNLRSKLTALIRHLFAFRWFGEKKHSDLHQYGRFSWEDNIEDRLKVRRLPPDSRTKELDDNYYATIAEFWWTLYKAHLSKKIKLISLDKTHYSFVEFHDRCMHEMRSGPMESRIRLATLYNTCISIFANYYPALKGEYIVGGLGQTFFTNWRLFVWVPPDTASFNIFRLPKLVAIPLHNLIKYSFNSEEHLVVNYREDNSDKTITITQGQCLSLGEANRIISSHSTHTLDDNQKRLLSELVQGVQRLKRGGRLIKPLILSTKDRTLINLPHPRYNLNDEQNITNGAVFLASLYFFDWVCWGLNGYSGGLLQRATQSFSGLEIAYWLGILALSFWLFRPIAAAGCISKENTEHHSLVLLVVWHLFECTLYVRIAILLRELYVLSF
ncbi:MAG: hypothetical protein CMK59_00360 [Proteobacteria bacterium]|nr:hypothetical protein [Pseudomonadota bacterium]